MAHDEHRVGAREQAPDQRQAQQIERVLVDEPLTRSQRDPGIDSLPVLGAQQRQLVGGELAEIRGIVESEGAHVVDDSCEKGLLVHRLEGRMRIERNLEQGRAGARKSDHEDRTLLLRRHQLVVPIERLAGLRRPAA